MANLALYEAGVNDRTLVENLVQLYLHDLSEFIQLEIGANGRFDQKMTTKYLGRIDHKVIIIHAEYRIIGFLLAEVKGDEMIVPEFFILRSWRRKHIAQHVMEILRSEFRRIKVIYDSKNLPAEKFVAQLENNGSYSVSLNKVGGNMEMVIA